MIIVLFWLSPLIIACFTSLKTLDEIMGGTKMWAPPKKVIFDNFLKVWNSAGMKRAMLNTFLITIPSVAGALFLSSLAGFALAFYKFKLNRIILIIFIAGMLLPFQMLMIPVERLSSILGVKNTWLGLILFHIAFQIGFCSFFLRNFMKHIPFSLIESMRIDGASEFMIYYKIVLPLSLPAIAALSVLEFTWIWNDMLWALVLIRSDILKPITLVLANMQGEFITYYNLTAAGSLIAAMPPVIIFLFFQKYFIEGLTLGAEKG
ncbi:MAG: carbohydrate ABC transporter permease [Spirochaetes bacterium]|nr:carbohydrate ABC transporter permease [Spirochaetota bacterium]